MKKIGVLFILTIYLTSCSSVTPDNLTTIDTDRENILEEMNLELENQLEQAEVDNESLLNDLDALEEENTILIDENLELSENNMALEEEAAEAVENLEGLQNESEDVLAENKSYSQTGLLTGPYNGQLVMEAAYDVLAALKNNDMAVFASYVNPMNGVSFSPTQNIDRNTMVQLSPTDIINMATDTSLYNWGNEQVSNTPINMTIVDYFSSYVYDEFYYQASIIGQNQVVSSGTVPNNISSVYFYSITNVEFLLPAYYTSNPGSEWRSITLSFLTENTSPELLAVIHGY